MDALQHYRVQLCLARWRSDQWMRLAVGWHVLMLLRTLDEEAQARVKREGETQ